MTLDNSADSIYCQTCASAWPLTDSNGQHYFESASFAIGSYASPAQIVAAAEEMTFCPKCDVRQLEPTPIPNAPPGVKGRDPFYERDDKMIGADVDKGQDDPGGADVVHRVP
jgi:hypothetical protein